MPPRPARPVSPDDAPDFSALRHELELSTFLNKGLLQNSSELKVRITELERENKVLRRAESKLAEVEDQLDAAQRRVAQLEAEVEDRDKEMDERAAEVEEKIRDALSAREGMKRENELLRGEVRGWREIGGSVIRRMGVAGLVRFDASQLASEDRGPVTQTGHKANRTTDDALTSRGLSRTAAGSVKPALPSSGPTAAAVSTRPARAVRRDVPQQRATLRDKTAVLVRQEQASRIGEPEAEDEDGGENSEEEEADGAVDEDQAEEEEQEQEQDEEDQHEEEEEAEVKAEPEPMRRAYRTRTTGPAPAFLRGDLRDGQQRENAEAGPSTRTPQRSTPNRHRATDTSRHVTAQTASSATRASGGVGLSAKRKRSRRVESGSAGDTPSEAELEPESEGEPIRHMAPASASRSASRNVIVKRARPRLSNTDTRHGGLRGAGAYADHRRQQDENHVMHADDGEMSEHDQEVPAGRRAHDYADEGSPRPEDRTPTPIRSVRPSKEHLGSTHGRIGPGNSGTTARSTVGPSRIEAGSAGPSQAVKPPSVSFAPTAPRGGTSSIKRSTPHIPRASGSGTQASTSLRKVKQEPSFAQQPAARGVGRAAEPEDKWGQPIIVKKERFSLSPDLPTDLDPASAAARGLVQSSRHGAYASHAEYGSDEDPLAGDM